MNDGIVTAEEVNTMILHTPGKMLDGKNLNAINKIIKELSYRDFVAAATRNFTGKIKSYSLGMETLEAMKVKYDYINERITEEEYKGFCLNYNLRTVKEG